jgi:hypothetical protein
VSEVVKWLLVSWFAWSALAVVLGVGKPRKPITPGMAALCLLVVAAEIVAVLVFWESS